MVDGRDIAVLNRMASACPLSAMAFADSKKTRLVGVADGMEIIVELEQTDYEWSNPAQGGVFPVRPITKVFIAKQSVPDVEFCGYIGYDNVLVTMDGSREVLERYTLNEAYMFE